MTPHQLRLLSLLAARPDAWTTDALALAMLLPHAGTRSVLTALAKRGLVRVLQGGELYAATDLGLSVARVERRTLLGEGRARRRKG